MEPEGFATVDQAAARADEKTAGAGYCRQREKAGAVLRPAVEDGAGGLAVHEGPGPGADEQSRGANASSGGDLAEDMPGVGERSGVPLCGAAVECGGDAADEGAKGAGLPGGSVAKAPSRAIAAGAGGMREPWGLQTARATVRRAAGGAGVPGPNRANSPVLSKKQLNGYMWICEANW